MIQDSKLEYNRWHEQLNANTETSDPMAFPWYRAAFNGIQGNIKGDILEIGCGRGQFALWLASVVPSLRVTGVDFSTSAVTIARGKIANGSKAVRFLAGDAQSLPFPEKTFDWIVSCECLEHLPEPQS